MEQVIKLQGRIAEVLPVQSGISSRTGDKWMSQDYVFEFYEWSGQQYASRVCCRVFGENKIKEFNLQPYEEVTLTLGLSANRNADGTRWYNEVRVRGVERAQNQAAVSEQTPPIDDLPY